MKNSEPTVAFVYLGNKLPRYFLRNLSFFRKTFPQQRLEVIVDNPRTEKELLDRGVDCFNVIHKRGWEPNSLSDALDHDLRFRSGFWAKTLVRFLALQMFITDKQMENVLHIESDVLVLPSFPFDKFKQIKQGLAFPLESPTLGIASTLFIKNVNAINLLCDFSAAEVKRDPKTTDMKVLGNLYRISPEKVFLLPTFFNRQQVREEFTNLKVVNEILRNGKLFDGIFDSVSIGQFFFGIDPRNNRGFVRRYINDRSHLIEVPKLRFHVYNSGVKVSKSLTEKPTGELYSLHIHSKDFSAFNYPFNKRRFQRLIESSNNGPVIRFNSLIFVLQLISFISRKFYVFK